jgi:ABC-2 type transport system ATP-binding protein
MIEVRNLSKDYGSFVALKNVSFSIAKGEIVGFLGPNGAGKTTAMKILTCFMPQTRGTVTIDGFDVNQSPLEVRKRIGYLPETNPLYRDMIVYDYLAHVGRLRGVEPAKLDGRIGEVLRMTSLRDRAGQLIGTLSKGLKQRVGLGQALIHDPPVLILDEPTSGLDPNQIIEIRNLIKELGADRTVILSTHNLFEVMATCNRMLIVHKGELVADGTPEELQNREETRPSIKIAFRGPSLEEAREALKGLEGVERVDDALIADSGVLAFEIRSARGADVRAAVFKLAMAKDWQLVELHRQVLDLEAIFQKLTREQ